jgi:hypothetical protein
LHLGFDQLERGRFEDLLDLQSSASELLSDLREKLRQVFDAVVVDTSRLSNPECRREIESEIPTLLLQAMTSGTEARNRLSSAVRSRAAHRALALIRERSEEPLTVQEICDSVGVSELPSETTAPS